MRVIMDEKGNKYLSCMLIVLKTFPFSSSWLSPFSPLNAAIVPLSDGCTLPISFCNTCTLYGNRPSSHLIQYVVDNKMQNCCTIYMIEVWGSLFKICHTLFSISFVCVLRFTSTLPFSSLWTLPDTKLVY